MRSRVAGRAVRAGEEAAQGREASSAITSRSTGPSIPNYGDRYRHGEPIATSFVESTVNQVISKRMVKKQQMRWTERGRIGCCRSAPGS